MREQTPAHPPEKTPALTHAPAPVHAPAPAHDSAPAHAPAPGTGADRAGGPGGRASSTGHGTAVAQGLPPGPLPMERPPGCPFDPPSQLTRLREERPLSRLSYPDGHVGWLATSYPLVRAVLADPRFSSRYELMHFPFPFPGTGTGITGALPPATVGDLSGIDPPGHTRLRRLLTGKFTVRRMRQLTSRMEEITAERLDVMERRGSPVDLVEAYARPVPALMICELLGVPYADRDFFRDHATRLSGLESTVEDQLAAVTAIRDYLTELVRAKRVQPSDDLLSDLVAGGELTESELSGVGGFLLGAGLDTTASMLAHGTFALLNDPGQLAALRGDPGLADQAVEELLRYLSIVHTSARAALEDVELDGQLIRARETVTLSAQAANRDPDRYPDPDRLDVRRQAAGHVAFGHGVHQCLGQQLARVEMRVAYPALFARFPTLRLAVPAEEVPLRTDRDVYGVHRLPVTWGEE